MGQKVNKNKELIDEYTRIFLEVSKELQHIGSNGKIDSNEKERFLLAKALEKLSVIYGYFVEFDPYKNQLEYFIDDSVAASSNRFTNFKPTYIPYLDKENDKLESLFQSIRKNKTVFKDLHNSPKIFQHLPIQIKSNNQFRHISDDYLNCFIPCKIKAQNDYFVVLFEEIVFFQFAYKYVNRESLSDFFDDRKKFLLVYLLKFSLSFEAKISKSELHDFLEISNEKDKWKTPEEAEIRNQIEAKVDSILKLDKFETCLEILKSLVADLLSIYRKKEWGSDVKDVQLLGLISRFDIPTSFLITNSENKPIPHDMFVFPLYTQSDNPVFKTKFIDPDFEIDIHSPLLLVLYIKTLYTIKPPDYDEDEESIDGFQWTKEIAKLFSEKFIQEDYLKNVIRQETNLQATKSAISSVMSRNMSHNIGSHVIPYLINHQADFNAVQTEVYNRYIQERMELIATIGTTYPNYLKTEITIGELVIEFTSNNVVLKGIVDGSINELFFKTEKAKNSFHLPGGQIGRQVFYSLLEGIIRNCKKHSNPKIARGSKQIELKFKIQECQHPSFKEDYFELHIVDQLGETNQGRDKSTLEDIREYLFKPILENGELRKGGWGILELKIAASLLIGFPLESIDLFSDGTSIVEISNKLYPPVLQVNFYDRELNIVSDENTEHKDIGYNLFIKKAKLIYTINEAIFYELKKITGSEILSFSSVFNENATCDFFIGDISDSYFFNYRAISIQQAEKALKSTNSKADILNFLWKEYIEINYKSFAGYEIVFAVPGTPIYEIERKIIFDSHGDWLKREYKGDFNSFTPAFYQLFNSKSSFGKLSEQFNSDILLSSKLVESAAVGISIFDERIQNETNSKTHEDLHLKLSENNSIPDPQRDFSNITLRELFNLSGIFVPDINFFSLQDFIDSKGNKADEYLDFATHPIIEQIRLRFQYSQFVLIHHTILELISFNLFKSKKQPDINRLYSMIYKELKLKDKHLVIISGLGLPSNLPNNCFFLNLVTVQNILLVMKSKYHLVQVLKSLRPINNKNV